MPDPIRFAITSTAQVETARRSARALAREIGFDRAGAEAVALAVSELGTNLVRYTAGGEIIVSPAEGERGQGIRVGSLDQGPGLVDAGRALEDGYSTSGGLGSGLPAVRRLMDDFDLRSGPDGTRVVAIKWLPSR